MYVAILLAGALVGCTPDPLENCRVGMSFDAAAFAAEADGGAVPDEVTLRQVKFSYKEYAVTADGGDYAVQVSNDGKIIGTYGGEPYLAKFARAFRALPAVLFDDLPSENPDVTIRGKKVDGVDYAYVVNTSDRPQTVRVRLSGMCDLVTDEKLEGLLGKDGLLKLEPYELKSFGNRMTGER